MPLRVLRLVALHLGCAAAIFLGAPSAVMADGPNNGNLLVPADHVMPGEEFRITGFDIDPGITLSVYLASGQHSAALGEITVAPDGTVEATREVPTDFPHGYAELHAVSASEGTWSTVVLIGPRAEGPEAIAGEVDAPAQTLAWFVLAAGVVIFVVAGLMFVRGRRLSLRD